MRKGAKDRRFFLHRQFMETLKNDLVEGRYKPTEMIPSERVLVEKYKISRSTVRKALAQLISEGWLYSAPGTGTFVSENFPKEDSFVRPKSKSVACVLKTANSPLDSPYYSKIFRSMQDKAAISGYHLSFYSFVKESRAELVKVIRDRKLDGVIIIGYMGQNIILDVYRNKIPMVLVDNQLDKKGVTTIVPDNYEGAFQATKYLIDLGHKTIWFMGGNRKDYAVAERFNGYRDALKQSGIAFRDEYYVKSHYRVNDGYNSMDRILRSGKIPSAVLCINDESAVGALKAIREKSSLRVPEDMSVIGFDDIDWVAHTNPPLTTVRIQKEEMGRMAIEFLIKQIENDKYSGARVIVPTELIIRSSCSKYSRKK
ncbi:MAG: GntR family transcriptional regulator [Candidatus Aureabacteria bacterium]|nr:GntR family transcriptional regulator [Candidatus Auribacterota bacterium]